MSTIDDLAGKFPEYDILRMDGYDAAIIGLLWELDREQPVIAYDRELVLNILVEREGMTYEDAVEFHEYNQAGAYLGPGTPVFL